MFLDLLLQQRVREDLQHLLRLVQVDQWFQQRLLVMHALYLTLVHAQVHSIHPVVQVLRLLLLDALFWRHSQRYPLRTFVRSDTS